MDDETPDSADQPEVTGTLGRRQFVGGTIAATVALTVGCDSEEGVDAAVPGDAGVPGDSSVTSDGGGRDAGGRADGGDQDAGALEDSGVEGDAGEPPPVDSPESFTESSSDFPLGVASGDATPSSAIFWTSFAGAGSIELVVWEMEGETYLRTVFAAAVTPSDGFVHRDVDTLEAGKRYRYTFFVVDAGTRTVRSAIGRMRAAIAADAMEPLTIGAVSCTNNTRALSTLAHAGARDDLDLFIYGGDTTYNDGARSLSDYREKWSQQLGRAEYKAVRGSTSALATWDDHEFTNNFDPETLPAAQRSAAVQTFFEYQPMRRVTDAPDRVWKLMRWGQTADIFVLDGRSERRPSTRGDTDIYLSRAQMDWLKAGLTASTAVFKVIVNSVPITDFPGLFDRAQGDRWEGYPGQRTEILSHIDDASMTGVIWVSGDFHLASGQRVGRSESDPGGTQVEVLVGPGAQFGNLLARTLRAPQFDFGSTTNNYAVLEFLPETTVVRIRWINGSGSAFEVQEYSLG